MKIKMSTQLNENKRHLHKQIQHVITYLLSGGHQRVGQIYMRLYLTFEECDGGRCWQIQGHCSERPWRVQCDHHSKL